MNDVEYVTQAGRAIIAAFEQSGHLEVEGIIIRNTNELIAIMENE